MVQFIMCNFLCPYLNSLVELTIERFQHISDTHPDLLPNFLQEVELTIAAPDQVRRSSHSQNALLFARWFESILDGKYIVVVVKTDVEPNKRHWIVTAYIARKLTGGSLEWQKT